MTDCLHRENLVLNANAGLAALVGISALFGSRILEFLVFALN